MKAQPGVGEYIIPLATYAVYTNVAGTFESNACKMIITFCDLSADYLQRQLRQAKSALTVRRPM